MNVITNGVVIVMIAGALSALTGLPANAEEKVFATVAAEIVGCSEKTFPNLPGENSYSLRKEKDGEFSVSVQSYGKPKMYQHLRCRFHSKDRNVFFCDDKGGHWGVSSQRVQSSSVEGDGSETTFDGYLFEVLKAPHGEPQTIVSMRFGAGKCARRSVRRALPNRELQRCRLRRPLNSSTVGRPANEDYPHCG
jgi:hypothetical protein